MKLCYIFFITLLTNCSNNYELSLKDKEYLIKTIDSIYEIDQGTRLLFDKIDSVYNLEQNSFVNRRDLKVTLGYNYEKYNKAIDSVWSILKIYDESNTRALIEITKKYGFPDNKRLGTYKAKAYMIFIHSPKKFFPEVRSLILEEYDSGRINEYKKEYILWHLSGRKGMPPRSSENGDAIYN